MSAVDTQSQQQLPPPPPVLVQPAQQLQLNSCKTDDFTQMPVKSIDQSEFLNSIKPQHSTCFNYSTTSLPSTSATLPTGSNTILITDNYLPPDNKDIIQSDSNLNNNNNSNSSSNKNNNNNNKNNNNTKKNNNISTSSIIIVTNNNTNIIKTEISKTNGDLHHLSMDKIPPVLNGDSVVVDVTVAVPVVKDGAAVTDIIASGVVADAKNGNINNVVNAKMVDNPNGHTIDIAAKSTVDVTAKGAVRDGIAVADGNVSTIANINADSSLVTVAGEKTENCIGQPPIVDSKNIAINNHINEMVVKNLNSDTNNVGDVIKLIKKEKPDEIPEPISPIIIKNNNNNINTAIVKEEQPKKLPQSVNVFSNGIDVLVQKKDSKFYLGTIIAVYPMKSKCLIKFDDSSEYTADFDELTLLRSKTNELDSEPMCVICKKFNENDIVELCERCGRGCHRLCAEGGYNNGIWTCKRCTAANGLKLIKKELNTKQLPYDLNALNWDSKQRVNEEQIYCYCGKTGRWEKKMLQCVKCLQWFHENCIRCIKFPLYNGDRFYIFACSICNNGEEFIRRLEMKWCDIVHLVIYNLTTNNHDKKYHHVTKAIIPYAIEHWSSLQLQNSIKNMSSNEIKDNIMKTLSLHKSRFKSGREIKKNNAFWGLRSRIPPAPPKIVIPSDVHITDEYIKQNLKINIIPSKSQSHYLRRTDKSSEDKFNNDLKFSSEDEIPIKNIITKEKKEKINACKTNAISMNGIQKLPAIKTRHKVNSKTDNNIKKPTTQPNKKKKPGRLPKIPTIDMKTKNNMAIKIGPNLLVPTNNNICDSSDETSSLGTLDLIIPPPKNFQGYNNPFRITPKKNETNYNNLNLMKNNHNNKRNFDITSKLVALKKSSGSIFKNAEHLNNRNFQTAGQLGMVKSNKRRLSAKDILNGSNLDTKKRPKLNQANGKSAELAKQTFPGPECLGTNSGIITSTITSTVTSAGASSSKMDPSASTSLFNSNINDINSAGSRRNLRKRQEKNYSDNPRRNSNSSVGTNCSNTSANGAVPSSGVSINVTATTIPNSSSSSSSSSTATPNYNNNNTNNNSNNNQSGISMSDLQTSVNMYFGAIERIKNGEKFSVKAKRKLPNGKTQYLVEWEAGGISTLNH